MRRIAALCCAAALLPAMLASCGSISDDESTVELTKNGKIIEYTVEDFSASNYDLDELKTFVDDEIKAYRQENKGWVRAKRVTEKSDKACLTIRYNSTDTYADFNGVECFTGTIEEAVEAGYDFSMDFTAVQEKKQREEESLSVEVEEVVPKLVPGSSLIGDESLGVLIIGTDFNVEVAGDVKYYYSSLGEASCTGRNTVQVSVDEEAAEIGNLVYVLYDI